MDGATDNLLHFILQALEDQGVVDKTRFIADMRRIHKANEGTFAEIDQVIEDWIDAHEENDFG